MSYLNKETNATGVSFDFINSNPIVLKLKLMSTRNNINVSFPEEDTTMYKDIINLKVHLQMFLLQLYQGSI